MGLHHISTGDSYTVDPRNPDPSNFVIQQHIKIGGLFVSNVHYPGCTNYEGKKILVTTFNPAEVTTLDPHFTEGSGLIARFEPTQRGWDMACNFARRTAL